MIYQHHIPSIWCSQLNWCSPSCSATPPIRPSSRSINSPYGEPPRGRSPLPGRGPHTRKLYHSTSSPHTPPVIVKKSLPYQQPQQTPLQQHVSPIAISDSPTPRGIRGRYRRSQTPPRHGANWDSRRSVSPSTIVSLMFKDCNYYNQLLLFALYRWSTQAILPTTGETSERPLTSGEGLLPEGQTL